MRAIVKILAMVGGAIDPCARRNVFFQSRYLARTVFDLILCLMSHHDEITRLASTSLLRALVAFALCWLLILILWIPAFAQVLVYVSVVPVAAALAAYRVRPRLIHIPYLLLYIFVAWQIAAMTYADS